MLQRLSDTFSKKSYRGSSISAVFTNNIEISPIVLVLDYGSIDEARYRYTGEGIQVNGLNKKPNRAAERKWI